jgi:hypothetical protein
MDLSVNQHCLGSINFNQLLEHYANIWLFENPNWNGIRPVCSASGVQKLG